MDAVNLHTHAVLKDVTWEEYMEKYAADFYEWVDGEIIKMTPVTDVHDKLSRFLLRWFEAFLEQHPIAEIRVAPFTMKYPPKRGREPDLQLVLNEHADRLKPTFVDGAADLVIEIVSEGSTSIDYGDKFQEYETAGVHEYWIIDPLRQEAHFYVLNEEGLYKSRLPNAEGIYNSVVLLELRIPIPLLWTSPLPGPSKIAAEIEQLKIKNDQ